MLVYPSSRTHIAESDVRPTCYTYTRSLARTQPSTKAKHPFAALSRFPSLSVHQNGFFSAAPAKSSYTCMHTHQQTTHESVLRAGLSAESESVEPAIELLFIFVHFAGTELTPVNCARE